MAIYSNFDGTMRNSFSVGKKGIVISRVGTADGISIDKPGATGAHGTITIADGTSATHAITKGQFDAKFGTGDSQVRLNTDLDSRYVLASGRNNADGYAGVGSNGKIESFLLPDIRLNRVFVVLNKFGRNVEPNLVAGDSCIITPTALYNPGMIYAKHDVVRVMEYGITKFYAATVNATTPPTFTASLWNSSTIQVGQTYQPGTVVLFGNKLYITTQAYTVSAGATLLAFAEPYSDVTICEWTGGTPYAQNDIVKVTTPGSVKYYSAKDNIPAMSTAEWTGTTITSGTSYAIGDEVLYNNKNFMVRLAYTAPNSVVNPATAVNGTGESIFVEDIASDAGYYILSRTPATPADGSSDSDWTSASSGTTVDSFNGRSGPVTPQTGDYDARQVSMANYQDLTSSTVEGNVRSLADSRVKKTGDKMTGTFTIAKGLVGAPSLAIPTSSKSGLFDDTGKIAFAIEGLNKFSIGATGLVASAALDMSTNVISKVGDPQSAGDAANKKYVDSKPLILSGTDAPVAATGKDGDIYMTVLTQGAIKMPLTETWTDVATDGITTMVVSNNAVPKAALTTNAGITWTTSAMPAASNDSTDKFAYVVSNNSDSFVAIRSTVDQSKNSGKIAYTSDRGNSWNSSTSAIPAGSYIPAAVYADGTAYMLFPVSSSNMAYSSTDGNLWEETQLAGIPASSWACAAGARGCYVALVADTANGSTICAYRDFGNTWRQSTMANALVWKSVSTADGVNFVAVGEAASTNKDTNVVNYSNNRGATWASATLPTSGRWAAVASNGTTFVATRDGSNKGAISTDSGRTWTMIILPDTRSWTRLVGNTRMYMALSTGQSRNDAVAVSLDGGRTWTAENAGQISDINVKNAGKWLAYAGFGGSQSNGQNTSSLYVRRDGDKMTGSLVLSHDASKDSIIASGAILSPALKATKYASNDSTTKTIGSIFMGAMNPDAVNEGNIYGYATTVEGASGGYSLITKAQARGANGTTTEVPMMTITKDTFNMAGSVGLGGQNVAYANAALAMDISKKKHGLSIFSGTGETNSNTEIISIASNNSSLDKHAIKIRANCKAIETGGTAPFTAGDYVFGVTTNGVVDIAESLYVGGNRGAAQPVACISLNGTSTYNTTLDINNVTMPKKVGIQMKYTAYSNSTNAYKHINIEEAADTSVFLLDDVRFMVNKKVQLNTSTSKDIALYIGGTDAIRIPSGTVDQRPATGEVGMIRFNSYDGKYEAYLNDAVGWQFVQVGTNAQGGTKSSSTWNPVTTAHPDGYNFFMELKAAETKVPTFSAPFFQFQTSVVGSSTSGSELVNMAKSSYKPAMLDYVINEDRDVIVYTYYEPGETKEHLRWYASWVG